MTKELSTVGFGQSSVEKRGFEFHDDGELLCWVAPRWGSKSFVQKIVVFWCDGGALTSR